MPRADCFAALWPARRATLRGLRHWPLEPSPSSVAVACLMLLVQQRADSSFAAASHPIGCPSRMPARRSAALFSRPTLSHLAAHLRLCPLTRIQHASAEHTRCSDLSIKQARHELTSCVFCDDELGLAHDTLCGRATRMDPLVCACLSVTLSPRTFAPNSTCSIARPSGSRAQR